MNGVNRFYVFCEHSELKRRFKEIRDRSINKLYNIICWNDKIKFDKGFSIKTIVFEASARLKGVKLLYPLRLLKRKIETKKNKM